MLNSCGYLKKKKSLCERGLIEFAAELARIHRSAQMTIEQNSTDLEQVWLLCMEGDVDGLRASELGLVVTYIFSWRVVWLQPDYPYSWPLP